MGGEAAFDASCQEAALITPCVHYGNAVVCGLMQTVVETPPYLADAERLLGEDERAAIVDAVATDPTMRRRHPGHRRCSQVPRCSQRARQTRRRARHLPVRRTSTCRFFCLAIFAKNEKSDLTRRERNALSKLSASILENYRRGQ